MLISSHDAHQSFLITLHDCPPLLVERCIIYGYTSRWNRDDTGSRITAEN